MFVKAVDVREGEVMFLDAILGVWSVGPPQDIKEGADIAMDLSSNRSANSSRYTLSAFSKSWTADKPPDPPVVLHISDDVVVVVEFDYIGAFEKRWYWLLIWKIEIYNKYWSNFNLEKGV